MIPIGQLHRLACVALELAGAQPCEKLLPDEEGRKLSDAVFLDDAVVVEVKSLTADRTKNDGFKRKLRDAVVKHLPGGLASFDKRDAFKGLPVHVANRLLLDLGRRMVKVIEKADRQIAETAERLALKNHQGLLVLVIPVNFGTHPGVARKVAGLTLAGLDCPNISGLLLITVPTPEGSGKHMPALVFHSRSSMGALPAEMLDRIGMHFLLAVEAATGINVTAIEWGEEDYLRHFGLKFPTRA